MTSTVIYEGELRTVARHLSSGSRIETDAPVDNQGKGEKFSPTDLVATALGSCMLTIMGMKEYPYRDSETDENGSPAYWGHPADFSFPRFPPAYGKAASHTGKGRKYLPRKK